APLAPAGAERLVSAQLGAWLLGALRHSGAGHQAFGNRVGHHAGEQAHRADRVVVSRDRVVDLVGVAVGVEDRYDRDVELARLGDGDVLLLRVHEPDGTGHPGHVADAAERLLQLVLLALQDQQLLLRYAQTRA